MHHHKRLDRLAQRIRIHGALAEETLGDAVAALVNRNAAGAAEAMAAFVPIGAFMGEVEEECLAILSAHPPVATDVRFVLAVLRMSDDLTGIAEVGHAMARQVRDAVAAGAGETPPAIRSLGTLTIDMLHDVVEAVAARDARLARCVLHRHAAVRSHRRDVCRWTIRQVRTGHAGVDGSLHVGWIARDIEHIAAITASTAVDLITTLEGWPLHGNERVNPSGPLPSAVLR